MLTNAKRIEMCYSLLSAMLPNDKALEFGFDENLDKRIILSYTNQTPRPDTKTVMYFTIKDTAYKQARSDPHHYTSANVEVMEHMRQITLTIDIFSKVVPMGMSNDVAQWLNTALISDMYYEWQLATGWSAVIENIEIMPDLSYLLEGQTWNNRAQMVVKLNYRDTTQMAKVFMTRVPSSLEDTPNSVDAKSELKS